MKITFEAKTLHDLLDEMEGMIGALTHRKNISKSVSEKPNNTAPEVRAEPQGPGPEIVAAKTAVDKPVDKPVANPVDKKPMDPRVAKMQAAKAAKKAEREAAAKAAAAPAEMKLPPPPKTAEGMDPAEVVKLRTKTIEELQAAYANGHQKEVFELLSRFGNGAKSFRELPADAFVPIREAIDNGALT